MVLDDKVYIDYCLASRLAKEDNSTFLALKRNNTKILIPKALEMGLVRIEGSLRQLFNNLPNNLVRINY